MYIEVNQPKHSSTLCLDDILYVESFRLIEDCEDEEQESYSDVEQPLVIPNQSNHS